MPTYRAKSTQPYLEVDGKLVMATEGQIIESYELLSSAQWDLVSAAPYYNPIAAVHSVVSAGSSQSVSLNAETDLIEIYNASNAEITVFLQAASNTPGMPVPANTIRTMEGLKGKVDRLVMQFSQAGSCSLTELKG